MTIRFLKIIAFMIAITLSMGYRSNQPTSVTGGYTGAPGDEFCNKCHSPSNSDLEGSIELLNLPDTADIGMTYSIQLRIVRENANISRAGFQMVSLSPNLTNGGEFSNGSAETSIKTAAGKQYFGHKPATEFDNLDTLLFDVDWSPKQTLIDGEEVNFYASAVLSNGNSNTSGDNLSQINTSTVVRNVSSTNEIIEGTRIYPNPAIDYLTIESGKDISEIKVFDVSGKEILNINSIHDHNSKVDLTNWRNGVYYLMMKTKDGQNEIKPFIVSNLIY